MCLAKNEHTDALRSLLHDWTIRRGETPFTNKDVCAYLRTVYDFGDIDLTKAVGNELLRYRSMNRTVVIGEEKTGTGRPPVLYKQVWCGETLEILKRKHLAERFEIHCGKMRVFVHGQGMVQILKPFNTRNKQNAKELFDYHVKRLDSLP